MHQFSFSTIGTLYSCYKEKFGIPRQPRLENESIAELILSPSYNHPDTVRDIEQFSHIWLIFIFNHTKDKPWKALIRPPRLGGNKRIGVFASRSTFRPNPIGMSAVELIKVNHNNGKVSLLLRGCDLVDGTPIIDIKPYLPYSDAIPNASAGFAAKAPSCLFQINFTDVAIQQCQQLESQLNQQKNILSIDLKRLITQILQLDPRPSYQQQTGDRVYAMRLYDADLHWQYTKNGEVLVIELVTSG